MAGRPKNKKASASSPGSALEQASPAPLAIGILADTHGVLSPVVPHLFAGVTHIIHAGDVGRRSILRTLENVAPVTAVAGNADGHALTAALPAIATGEIAGVRFLVVHKPKAVKRLLPAARRDGVRLIVTGHLHEPSFRWEDGILHLNPGSASAPDEGDSQATVAIVGLLPEGLAVSFIPVPRAQAATKPRAKSRGRSGGKAKSAASVKAAAAGVAPTAGLDETGHEVLPPGHSLTLDDVYQPSFSTFELVASHDGLDGLGEIQPSSPRTASPLPSVTYPSNAMEHDDATAGRDEVTPVVDREAGQ